MRDGDSLKIVQADVSDFESKERGDGFAQAVVKILHWFRGVIAADSASRNEEFFTAIDLAEGGVDFVALLERFNLGGSTAGAPNHSVSAGGVDQAIDDRFRLIGGGEHAPIGLGLERDAALLEPSDGVGGLKMVEGADEVFLTARVILDQFLRVVAIMCDIAAASARDAHLREDFRALFEDQNF